MLVLRYESKTHNAVRYLATTEVGKKPQWTMDVEKAYQIAPDPRVLSVLEYCKNWGYNKFQILPFDKAVKYTIEEATEQAKKDLAGEGIAAHSNDSKKKTEKPSLATEHGSVAMVDFQNKKLIDPDEG